MVYICNNEEDCIAKVKTYYLLKDKYKLYELITESLEYNDLQPRKLTTAGSSKSAVNKWKSSGKSVRVDVKDEKTKKMKSVTRKVYVNASKPGEQRIAKKDKNGKINYCKFK
jgi:hypothetical protein